MPEIQVYGTFRTAIIDYEDYDRVTQHKWYYGKSNKAISTFGDGKDTILLSRFILDIRDPSILVDHINRDKFDNRKQNLRLCNKSQNAANCKARIYKYKGITYNPRNRNWNAQIKINYKKIHLGCFKTDEGAARAYDEAAKKYFGEFARLNFPE